VGKTNKLQLELMDYIDALETSLGKTAEKELLPPAWRYSRYLCRCWWLSRAV